jgi:hypothetical protein
MVRARIQREKSNIAVGATRQGTDAALLRAVTGTSERPKARSKRSKDKARNR